MLRHTNIEKIIVNENSKFEELLIVLNRQVNPNFGSGFAIIVNSQGNIVGTVEDSDLRKFLSKVPDRTPRIKDVMQTNFISVSNYLSEAEALSEIISQMDSRGWTTSLPVKIIPVLKDRKPIGLIDTEEIHSVIKHHKSNNIVIGLGYIGLTVALSMSALGRKVYGFDINATRIKSLRQYKSYIVEPGLDSLLKRHLNINFHLGEKLFLVDNKPGIQNIYFICVGTPLSVNKTPDLGPIWSVVEELLKILKNGDVIVMRSTVPIGLGREIISFIENNLNWSVGVNFHYISAPERTVEGNALKEITELPQILSGATESCHVIGLNIFRGLSNSVTLVDKIEGAELVKIIGNAYRDFIFGFSNYFIEICRRYKLDINQIIESSNRGYPRSNIPSPSPGVGGPCLSKDTYFLPKPIDNLQVSPLISVRNLNENVPKESVKFIAGYFQNLKEFTCLGIGITFKGMPETNDYRNSPSIDFLESLSELTKSVKIWDSNITELESFVKFQFDTEFDRYNFFAILNNNSKNIEYFNKKISEFDYGEIIVFDPWRLIKPSQIFYSNKIKILNYFSLSHYEKFFI